MNRRQQVALHRLDDAQAELLLSFGWMLEGRRWRHPLFHGGTLLCTMNDAVLQTRAHPMLGWPQR